ncbi:MAG: hypothetical protein M3Q33_09445, partial [Acidobacteriota bacterium]|nr:hypothetical protein [Acidobacteriota bacterium]
GEANQLVTNFDFDQASPLNGRTAAVTDAYVNRLNPTATNLRGLLSYPEGGQTKANRNRFSPRVGFAYSFDEKTTLRGGYGIFFLPQSLEGTTAQGTNFTQGLLQSSQTTQVGATTTFLTDPFPTGVQVSTGNSLGNLTRLGSDIFAVEPKRKNSYNQQWNLVVQRQLAKNLVLDIAYVGSRGVHLPIQQVNLNQITQENLLFARDNFATAGACGTTANPTAACTDTLAFLNFQVANPFLPLVRSATNPNGVIPIGTVISPATNGVPNPTIPRIQLLRPFPQYNNVFYFRPLIGDSQYHALQINLQKRFSDGLSGTASYVYSRLKDTSGVGNGAAFLDPAAVQNIYNYKGGEYSLSTLDVPHRFVASFTYELPFGRKKRFGKNLNPILNEIFGGFQISGTATAQSGTPLLITSNGILGLTGAGVGNAVRRPDRVGANPIDNAQFRENARAGISVFAPLGTTFADAPAFTFGNAARTYDDVRRDRYKNVDFSVIKNFGFNENKNKLQLRAEFLNLFNYVVFGTPGTNINASNYGIVTSQGNRPRIIQLVGRFTF